MRQRTWLISGGIVALACVGMTIGWLYGGQDLPPYYESLYDEAEVTNDRSLDLGFVTVRLAAVARNNRDGTVTVANGKGKPAEWEDVNIGAASSWLDRAAVKLVAEGGEFEIIQAQIFDHRTKEDLVSEGSGASVSSPTPTTIAFNRIGGLLPKTVDVWVRASIRRFDQPSYRISAKPGSSVQLGGMTVTAVNSISGRVDWITWNKEKKLVGTGGIPELPGIRTHLRFQGRGPDGQYHVIAVGRDGSRYYHGRSFRFSSFGPSQPYHRPVEYAVALADLDHFVVEPATEPVTFIFEAVELPPGDDGFEVPPSFKIPIRGQEITEQVVSFGALSIKVLSRQRLYHGIAVGWEEGHAIFKLDPGQGNQPTEGRTVMVLSNGMNLDHWNLTLIGEEGKELSPGKTRGWSGSAGSEWLKSKGSAAPLSDVAFAVLSPGI